MAPAASAQQPARPDSPPYVTSDMHQSMEAYQRSFWQRQMARVEEQVSLPDEQAAAVAHARRGDDEGEEDDEEGDDDEEDDEAPMTDAQLAASAKELMELFKPQAGQLPLARIKKVMKASDDDVKMISAEAPILFARACEIFIADLTCRSYLHATANRRRTVRRSDVVAAVAGSNVFDFLVDIMPRGQEETAAATTTSKGSTAGSANTSRARKESEEGEPEAEA